MDAKLDLKAIERKAFRSTYQDGLWDIYFGLIVVGMALFTYRPATGYSGMNILLCVLTFSLAYALFAAGKHYLTVPRMGQVKFGELRKRRNKTLAVIMGIFVLLQVVLVGLTACGLVTPLLKATMKELFQSNSSEQVLVALIGSFIVGSSMILIAHFTDFTRGYYIAILMSLAVFVMIFFNQPWLPVIIGGVIILPGVVLLVRFLNAYPLPPRTPSHE
jgi:uncharacterized membrane protein (DUF485 family)